MNNTFFNIRLSNGSVRQVSLDNEDDWLHLDTVNFSGASGRFTGRCRWVNDDGNATEIKGVTDENLKSIGLNEFCRLVNRQAREFL